MASSRSASRRRRQAARRRLESKWRREGRHPVHTQTEFRRDAAEGRRQRKATQRRQRWNSRAAATTTAAIGAGLCTVLTSLPPQHREITYPFITAKHLLAVPTDRNEQPHNDLRETTPFDPFIPAAATATTGYRGVLWADQEARERYGDWGPLRGD